MQERLLSCFAEKFFDKKQGNICMNDKIALTLHRKSPEGRRIRFNSSVG